MRIGISVMLVLIQLSSNVEAGWKTLVACGLLDLCGGGGAFTMTYSFVNGGVNCIEGAIDIKNGELMNGAKKIVRGAWAVHNAGLIDLDLTDVDHHHGDNYNSNADHHLDHHSNNLSGIMHELLTNPEKIIPQIFNLLKNGGTGLHEVIAGDILKGLTRVAMASENYYDIDHETFKSYFPDRVFDHVSDKTLRNLYLNNDFIDTLFKKGI